MNESASKEFRPLMSKETQKNREREIRGYEGGEQLS